MWPKAYKEPNHVLRVSRFSRPVFSAILSNSLHLPNHVRAHSIEFNPERESGPTFSAQLPLGDWKGVCKEKDTKDFSEV